MAVGPLRPDLKLPMIATRDIGAASVDALLSLDFHQKQTRELLGPRDIIMTEVAQIIGSTIGKSDLQYTQAPDEQVRPALIQLGMSANMPDLRDVSRLELRLHAGVGTAFGEEHHPDLLRNVCEGGVRAAV